MKKTRIIARLDIKNQFVIKGIQLEGLRKVGSPVEMAKKYYENGIDEIIFIDAVASLYGRNNLFHIIEEASKEVFVPITIGGGIKSLDDIELALKSGADKVAINTNAVLNENLITEASRIFGAQCIVGSIEAKKTPNMYEVYIETGREQTNIDALKWAKKMENLGVGEIFITSIDKDGTKKGYDRELINGITNNVSIPVIGCGGAMNSQDILETLSETNVDALAIGSILHYDIESISDIKNNLSENKVKVRTI